LAEGQLNEQDQKRWERLRRALLNIVAQQHDADPSSRYTLEIRVVPKETARRGA
jgi:hypothetical protein